MPGSKKGPAKETPKDKSVEKLTDEELGSVAGGVKPGANGWPCPPDTPCAPAVCQPIPCLPHKWTRKPGEKL